MKAKLSMQNRHKVEGYVFVAPWIIGFILFMAYPLIKSLYYSFQDLKVTTAGLQATFVGMKNYNFAYTVDIRFLPGLTSTISSVLTFVPLVIIFSLSSALLLNKPILGRTMFRAIFFLPIIVASGAVLQKLMDQQAATLPMFSSEGLIVTLLLYIPPEFLFPILRAMDSLTLVMWASGVQILIFLAGLQTISPALYEAAQCDGATRWEMFWKITLPMIVPMIFVNILFSIVYTFTNVNNEVMRHIQEYMRQSNYGYSAAMGWMYFLVIFIIIGVVFFLFRNSSLSTDERGT